MRKENNQLKKQLDFLSSSVPQGTENFQQGEDKFSIRYKAFNPMEEEYYDAIYREEKTWNEIFACVSTLLLNPVDRDAIKEKLEKDLYSNKYFSNELENKYGLEYKYGIAKSLESFSYLWKITQETFRTDRWKNEFQK